MYIKMVMISANIREADKEFLKINNIGITELFQTAIFERRNQIEGLTPNFETMRQNRDYFQKRCHRMTLFLEKKGLINEFIDEENKTNVN